MTSVSLAAAGHILTSSLLALAAEQTLTTCLASVSLKTGSLLCGMCLEHYDCCTFDVSVDCCMFDGTVECLPAAQHNKATNEPELIQHTLQWHACEGHII